MSEKKPDLFRKRALEHISSPEQLDQLLRVTRRRNWIPLFVVAAISVLVGIWSATGRISVTVQGDGILIFPSQIVALESSASGQVVEVLVTDGSEVAEGDVVARIAQPDLRRELEQEEQRLAELRLRESELGPLRIRKKERELSAIENRRTLTAQMIAFHRESAEELRERSEEYFREQRRNAGELRTSLDALGAKLRERKAAAEELEGKAIRRDDILELEKELVAHEASRAELEMSTHQVALEEIRAANAYRQMQVTVRELEAALDDLRTDEERIGFAFEQETTAANLANREVELRIERLERQVEEHSVVRSPYAGRILEVSIAEGRIITEGQRIASLEASGTDASLEALCFYDLGEGKKIDPGDPIQLTPSTVQRARYGSIRGEVIEISTLPLTPAAIERKLGNAELADRLSGGGSRLQVRARLFTDPVTGGFQWTSGKGPDLEISPGTTLVAHTEVEVRTPLSLVLPILRELGGD